VLKGMDGEKWLGGRGGWRLGKRLWDGSLYIRVRCSEIRCKRLGRREGMFEIVCRGRWCRKRRMSRQGRVEDLD
jgi:hypothetical protein